MTAFEDATYEQIYRLYRVVRTGKKRNWDWLLDWTTGQYDNNIKLARDPEAVVALYEEDEGWPQ